MSARVLFVTENYPPDRGGMGESCDRIVRGLGGSGVLVDVVHFDRRAARASHQGTSTGSLTRVPPDADPAHTINLLWNRLQQTVDLRAISHVVAFGGTLPLLSAPTFAAWMQRPLITLLRGNELDAGLFDPRRRPILDDALRRSSAVCTVTTEHARKVAALYPGIQPHVVANGIDFDLWQATDADRARAAAWLAAHVEPSRRVLGLFGHLKSKKGVPFFVDTVVRSGLADRFHLLLIGELDDVLQATLDEHPEVKHTRLTTVDRFDLLPFYLASDLVVLPSHYDGFPNVLIEAMALARPLLASSVGGMRDVLVDGEQAFLFPPGDAHACRGAIVRAAEASDPELLRMGTSAAAVAHRRCDADHETRRYLEVLATVQEVFDAQDGLSLSPGAAPRELSSRADR
ncbi:MAG: glycogen synthase [Acidobacteriota bacterium]|jgi:glycosyltransferase involved in cell wall biosynthesis|nr:glycogen synthase [Acidobacteriota bacterium]